MEMDRKLLRELHADGGPIFHGYDWNKPSATYGHFIHPHDFLCPEGIQKIGLDIAKRPTGGGIILHGYDLAFSVLLPSLHPNFSLNTLDNYAFINSTLIEAVRKFLGSDISPLLLPQEFECPDQSCCSFCMAKPTKFDVMLGGKKVAGGAQRRSKQGYLHQGSICMTLPEEDFLNTLLIPGTSVKEQMYKYSFPLLGSTTASDIISEAKGELFNILVETFSKR